MALSSCVLTQQREREKQALWYFFIRGHEGGALAVEFVPLRRDVRGAESTEGHWWGNGVGWDHCFHVPT